MYYLPIILIIFILLIILIFILRKNKHTSPTVKHIPKTRFPVGTDYFASRHGVNTGCFPRLPLPLFSKLHSQQNKLKLNKLYESASQCGKCEQLEKQLVEQAISYINQASYSSPQLSPLAQSCPACQKLMETWQRYFTILSNVKQYMSIHKLPDPPAIESANLTNQHCRNVYETASKFATNVKNEIECLEKRRECYEYTLPTDYKQDRNCPDCQRIYTEYMVYIFSLLAITNYIRCNLTMASQAQVASQAQLKQYHP